MKTKIYLLLLIIFSLIVFSCAEEDDEKEETVKPFFSDNFDRADLGANYTVTGDCQDTNTKLLCFSNGSGPGTAMYNTTVGTSNYQKVTARLNITGGHYYDIGTSVHLILWADNSNFGSASTYYTCGFRDGELAIRDASGPLQTGTGTDYTVGGSAYDMTFIINGSDITCTATAVSGSSAIDSETITYTLSTFPSGNSYAGLSAGWYTGTGGEYALWDDFVIHNKN